VAHLLWPVTLGVTAGCQEVAERSPVEPVEVKTPGVALGYYKAGDFYLAGQPSEEGFDHIKEQGIKTVVNLREEKELRGFDEKSAVESRGMTYVSIPVNRQSMEDGIVSQFIKTLKEAERPVLIHCGGANRVSGLWAIYMILEKKAPQQEVLTAAQMSGLKQGYMMDFVADYLEKRAGQS
jgi:uncharacterized protein (TIGR01244 family)